MKTRYLLLAVAVLLIATAGLAVAQEESRINPAQPTGITVDEIIRKFVEKETSFARARENYTYRQTVKVQTLDGDTPDGEYQNITDIQFDQQGKRVEQVVFAPQSTLSRVSMTREDFDTIRSVMPFVMTNQTLPDYQINYVGQQKVDELDTYVFDVAPKQLEKNKVYFQGRVWVDKQDLQIVMTSGRTVPEARPKKGQENLFPKFTTWREQIDGQYWFPTYTRADDDLHFTSGDIHIREIVKYSNYKRFGSAVKITYEGKEVEKTDAPAQPGQQPPAAQQPPAGQKPPQKPPQ